MDAFEKAAQCSRCNGKNITSTQGIYVGYSEIEIWSSHTAKDNKNF